MADIMTTTAIIDGVSIRVELHKQYAGTTREMVREDRPADLADADTMLAFHGFKRVGAWDLGDQGIVTAPVAYADNRFGGTPAARLWAAVGTTHDQWEQAQAHTVRDGDLVSDLEICAPYVAAATRPDGDTFRIHMVGEGQTWADRYTTDFDSRQYISVARRKA